MAARSSCPSVPSVFRAVTDRAGGEEKFVGGLSVATFITLLLVPVIYAIFMLDLKLAKWEKVQHTETANVTNAERV
jgi:hypothetical protein